jgi:DNA-binding response OmpR family regulator
MCSRESDLRLLLAEDDQTLCAKLVRVLHAEAFAVDVAGNGEDAAHLGSTESYDCVILDLGLPVVDGISVLRQWRAEGLAVPVIVLTARDAWADKSTAFAAGADDYLTKPFLPQELVVRVRALVRRARGQTAEIVSCGPIHHDVQTGGFFHENTPMRLTRFETQVLAKLMQFREHVVERKKLFDCIYEADSDVPANSLEVIIGRLRRKIGTVRIETVRGLGYRLTASQPAASEQ